LAKSQQQSQQTAVTGTSPEAVNPLAELEARRNAQEARIAEGRRVGKLQGMGYLALLGEQQKLLVAVKRAEANGLTTETRSKLMEALDRAEFNINKQLSLR
jgi:hypothetical protein